MTGEVAVAATSEAAAVSDAAAAFDPVGAEVIARLLARAEERGGAAGERLRGRAAERARALEEAFGRARERASALAATELQRATAERGDVAGVLRARWREAARARWTKARAAWLGADPGAQGLARARHAAAYAGTRADLLAELAVTHAADTTATMAGPYNSRALAARALAEVARLSPEYLRAQLARLDRLAALLAASPPPARAPARRR